MNFIKKIFDGKTDESVHLQFQKYGRGEFRDRALIRVKISAGKFTINTSAEFANELVRIMAVKLGETKCKISGAIVSTSDLVGQLDFIEKKQFQGVKKYLIENEISGKELLTLLDKFPKAFFALSFEVGENKLKIKPKAPKSGKPGKGDEDAKADFCKLITKDKEIVHSFVFEDKEFKEVTINHSFLIDEIVVPKELAQEKDFAKVRESAQRKGRIIRNILIDGQVFKEEKNFVA